MPHLFSAHKLRIFDSPTATSEVVLASMDGRPNMPEDKLEAKREHSHGRVSRSERDAVLVASGSASGSRESITINGGGSAEEVVKDEGV